MAMEHGLVERNTKLLPNRDRDAIPGPAYGVAMMFLSRKKITMPDFTFDSHISSDGPTGFLNLPSELLIRVIEEIDHAPSQICLALTCKTFAGVARRIELASSNAYTLCEKFVRREQEIRLAICPLTVEAASDFVDLSIALAEWARLANHNYQLCARCHFLRKKNPSQEESEWVQCLENMEYKKQPIDDPARLVLSLRDWTKDARAPICPSCIIQDWILDLGGPRYPFTSHQTFSSYQKMCHGAGTCMRLHKEGVGATWLENYARVFSRGKSTFSPRRKKADRHL